MKKRGRGGWVQGFGIRTFERMMYSVEIEEVEWESADQGGGVSGSMSF